MPPNWSHVVLDHQEPPGGSAGDYYDPLMVAPWLHRHINTTMIVNLRREMLNSNAPQRLTIHTTQAMEPTLYLEHEEDEGRGKMLWICYYEFYRTLYA